MDIKKIELALIKAQETLRYYASACGEDDQDSPAKSAIKDIEEVIDAIGDAILARGEA